MDIVQRIVHRIECKGSFNMDMWNMRSSYMKVEILTAAIYMNKEIKDMEEGSKATDMTCKPIFIK